MRDQNRYLQKRGQRWHYVRRVPTEFSQFHPQAYVRCSLKTTSLEVAVARRDALVEAEDAYWTSLILAEGAAADEAALKRYEAARRRAMAKGFIYVPMESLVSAADTADILDRLGSLEKSSITAPTAKQDVEALLGNVQKPSIKLSRAFALYCEKIALTDLIGKSDVQKKAWRKSKQRAINNFVEVCGDLSMAEIERGHGQKFYDWWGKRLLPDDDGNALAPNSANREIGTLRKLYTKYWEFEGEESRPNPFRKLRYSDKQVTEIPHFDDLWVRTKILRPQIFEGLNSESILLMYAMIETGCRPSELANLLPENILLDKKVPFIRIRPNRARQLKSDSSVRDIPLIGVSLLAMRLTPQGFPHYRDKGDLLSASLMKAFRSRDLFPTPSHKIYSFRHSFEKRMLEAGLDYGLRCLLMGHKNTRLSYGDGGSMEYRRDELLKIAHPVPNDFEDELSCLL